MNTTYGVNSDVRSIFNACGSTSKIAIFPSLCMRRMVSNLVPYIASSCVPANEDKQHQKMRLEHLGDDVFGSTNHILNIHWPQCQPSFHRVTQNSSCDRFLRLGEQVLWYLRKRHTIPN